MYKVLAQSYYPYTAILYLVICYAASIPPLSKIHYLAFYILSELASSPTDFKNQ